MVVSRDRYVGDVVDEHYFGRPLVLSMHEVPCLPQPILGLATWLQCLSIA